MMDWSVFIHCREVPRWYLGPVDLLRPYFHILLQLLVRLRAEIGTTVKVDVIPDLHIRPLHRLGMGLAGRTPLFGGRGFVEVTGFGTVVGVTFHQVPSRGVGAAVLPATL